MNSFEQELMRRSPLAGCVLEVCDFLFDEAFVRSLWEQHRGRCYEDVLRFEAFLRLMRDALLHHGGSAHRVFVELETHHTQPCDESNFYRKLARTPVALSRALLRESSQRLLQLLPESAESLVRLPGCFDAYTVVVGDGKKIKNAAKRLAPTRGYRGKLLGAVALVGLDLRSGMTLAMSECLDGLRNEVPLVEELMSQLHAIIPGPMLSVWDRQFDDVATMRRFCQRDGNGDAFVVRAKQRDAVFTVESAVKSVDAQGREVRDEIGVLGQDKKQMRLRRITLRRDNGNKTATANAARRSQARGKSKSDAKDQQQEEDVVLLSNLLDRQKFAAADLLGLYRHRWGIEQVFQQVTETFSLKHLIGSSPKATLLQFSYCLLLYNLLQLIRSYVANDGHVLGSVVSMFYLFNDVKKELSAWAYHGDGAWPRMQRDARRMRRRLEELLQGSWHAVAYTKASDRKPRQKPKPKPLLRGGYSSVQRLLEGNIKLA
jgi:hypothetical protein